METIRHHAEAQRFELEREGRLSVVDYQLRGDRMVIAHTFVPFELRGHGLAEKLVRAALAYARSESLKVIPQCGYVTTHLRRHPEDADLLAE